MKALAAAFILALAAPAFAQPGRSASPDGTGDPNAITCRPPQPRPESRLPGPEVCKTNAIWAQYRKDGMDVAADGIHDVHSEKWRSTTPQACHPVNMGGSGTTTANLTNFSILCE